MSSKVVRAALLCAASTVIPGVVPTVFNAHASLIDFSTIGWFECAACQITGNGTGDVIATYGTGANTATLEFSGVNAIADSNSEFVTAGYGSITAAATGDGAALNGKLTIDILQTQPGTSPLFTAFPIGYFSGLVSPGASTSWVDFQIDDPEVALGSNTYELDTFKGVGSDVGPYGYTIASPTASGAPGVISLQGNILVPMPEPPTVVFAGIGCLFIAIAERRRRRSARLPVTR